jgi:hypothetical protein
MLLLEARSFVQRMRILSEKRKTQAPIDLGPLFEESPSGELVPCKATFARTQYIEFLLARYSWVTDADLLLALDGWDKATKCTPDISGSGSASMREHESSSQYPLALNR